ncbi:hypothetical protein CRUP_010791 [Coryphaenoides rupestris]|nr:hypothetical protein CRUP_010791 [Coryphaenoides rupestris]
MRTLEEVRATMQIAKLQDDELLKTVHCLSFGQNVLSADYSLMELDDTLLVIRGDKDERAVLCSGDKTYDLKLADTSNLLLFVPGCKTPDQLTGSQDSAHVVQTQIWGFCSSYWELRKQRPKLRKLKQLLMENPYEGPALRGQVEEEDTGNLYTMQDLLERIQASEVEIQAQLQTLHACQLVDSESWSFSKVPLDTCLEELSPLEPREMIEHWLNCYGKQFTEKDGVFYALDEDKVCRATALLLLQNAVKFNLREFQDSLALVDRGSGPDTICLLRVEDLSEDTQERFNQPWTEADITPYIQLVLFNAVFKRIKEFLTIFHH